jgi:CheY-like chemotaxis protein
LGKGSRFTIRLPALPAETQIVEQEEQPVKLRRVLIVDDEENIALILQAALEKIPDCEVSIATNAQLAVRLFEERPFDLLITDFMMPDVDGITLASRIRQLYPQTAIVMVTAYGDNALRERAADAAIRHVLDKPVQLGDIRDVALSLLSDLDQS